MMYELISIRVGEQEFCIDVQSVREIRGWTAESPMPHAPDYLRGVINLRGIVLPIVDLAHRLGFTPTSPSARHAIVVVEANSRMLGLVVDAVSDIFKATAEDIQSVPDAASDTTRQFIKGVIPNSNRLVSLIDVTALVPGAALAA